MRILVTGAAGFIGFHLCRSLLNKGHQVIGFDNINDYYDVKLKFDRLNHLGINPEAAKVFDTLVNSDKYSDSFLFYRSNLENKELLPEIFANHNFDVVVNLAAQAGVRYSIENPQAYVDSNLVGFVNLLECCRKFCVKKLLYASSSSVYGNSTKVPFKTSDITDKPISLYAATKKSNELMAHTYSHLFGMQTIGLRFFTVYGPWGRPDMAMFLFADAILNNRPIKVFNEGNLSRDFTFIDDIVSGICLVIESTNNPELYQLFNIGNSKPVQLLDFIKAIEKISQKVALKLMLPMQPGDVTRTWADVEEFSRAYGYRSTTSVDEGVESFLTWFEKYYNFTK